MLNENLIDSPDVVRLRHRIAVLEEQITAFKKYDEQRKEYYRNIVLRCGEMESYIAELEDTDERGKRISNLQLKVETLRRVVRLNNFRTDIPKEEEERLLQAHKIQTLLEKIKKQDRQIQLLRKNIDDLLYRLNKVE